MAYRFLIVSVLPAVAYTTAVDRYILTAFVFMLANVVEAALWPSLGLDAGASSPGHFKLEYYWAIFFEVAFALYNAFFWLRVAWRTRRRARQHATQLREYEERYERRYRGTLGS